MTNTHPRYIAGIDGLRALAVLSVILYHFHPGILPGGFSGVDVFFVISGYVVTGSLLGRHAQGITAFLSGFYARRLLRIYPALLVCLLVTALFKTWFIPLAWLSYSIDKTGLAAFLGLSNFALLMHSDGYFSSRVEMNPFTHMWSLAVEEQFYLLFPWVLLVWFKAQKASHACWHSAKWLLPGLLLISMLVSWWQSLHQPDHAYYLLPSRFWELASGACLRLWHANQVPSARPMGTHAPFLGLGVGITGLGLLLAGFLLAQPEAFPMPWALLSVLGTLVLIHRFVQTPSGQRAPMDVACMGSPALVYVGKLSYSLYLWHWPVIVLLRWTVGDDSLLSLTLAWLLTALLAASSYHLVEQRFSAARRAQRWGDTRVLWGGGLLVACGLVLAWGLFKQHAALTFSVTGNASEWHPPLLQQPRADFNLSQPRPPHLFVMGDSHVGAYAGMLNTLSEQEGWVVSAHFKGGCAVVDLLLPASAVCRPHVQSMVEEVLRQAKPGDWVFLVSLRTHRLADQWQVFSDSHVESVRHTSQLREQAMLSEASDLITRLESAGLRVILDAPKPVFRSPPFRCSDWFNARHPVCAQGFQVERAFLQRHREPVMQRMAALQRAHPALKVWDAFPYLCPQTTCNAYQDGHPLFFDGDHLSGYGNQYLYPHFVDFLRRLDQTDSARPG